MTVAHTSPVDAEDGIATGVRADLRGAEHSSVPRRQRMVRPAAVFAVGSAGALLLHFVSPGQGSFYPHCPFLALTGYYCPGCGSTRMCAALTHGDLHTAMDRNPLGVFAVALLAVIFVQWTMRQWTGAPRTISRPWVPIALGVVVVAYWVTRNIPGWTFLSPQ